MADGVAITAGSGTTIATDDAGAPGHVQLFKLAISTDGSATLIPADSSNGLDVDVTRVQGTVTVAIDAASLAALETTELGATTLSALENTTVTVGAALPAGTNNIGDVDVLSLPALPAGNNNIGDVDVASLPALAAGTATVGNVGLVGSTSGGLSIFKTLDIDETEEDVKTSAGQVYGYTFANQATAWRWLKFYNATAASVTVGTTTPVITVGLPPSSAGHVPWPQGIAFSTAISVAATTGVADNDTGAPAANDVVLAVFYS